MSFNFWILTIPHHEYTPYLPTELCYVRGQLECSNTTQFLHWQLVARTTSKVRLTAIKKLFGNAAHAEPTKSKAANDYVWKDDTAVPGTRFELGELPLKRNCPKDWDLILEHAKQQRFDSIPADVQLRCWGNITKIAAHYAKPLPVVRTVYCFIGPTGTGKSRRAWDESGLDAYPKAPLTKFWDGYRGQDHVVIDEFSGVVAITSVLRWFDRYPVLVEIKGSAVPLVASKIWITSNLEPEEWYPNLPQSQMDALKRRLIITRFIPEL